MAGRTKSGSPTASERKKSGTGPKGKFPVFDHKSAMSAIKLRHNGKGISCAAVLAKVSKWAATNDDAAVKAAVAKARKADSFDKDNDGDSPGHDTDHDGM